MKPKKKSEKVITEGDVMHFDNFDNFPVKDLLRLLGRISKKFGQQEMMMQTKAADSLYREIVLLEDYLILRFQRGGLMRATPLTLTKKKL